MCKSACVHKNYISQCCLNNFDEHCTGRGQGSDWSNQKVELKTISLAIIDVIR